jgi:D-3-phosphoglycerate dehydrogenase / 2-oxoglutarate reductase
MKPLLLVLDDWEGQIEASPCWSELKGSVDIRFLSQPISMVSESDLISVSFLMTLRERTVLNEAVFSKLPNLKLVLQTGGHAYHVDTGAAEKRGISIALGRKVKAPQIAVPELTIAMALGLIHLIPESQFAMRDGKWPLLTGRTLAGKRLGILGLGRHGSKVADLAKSAFNMEVMAWDRPGSNNASTASIPRLSLDELLRTSDLISIHLKLSEESKGLLNADRLKKMKPGAILINTSRGAIVDEQALIEELRSGHLGGAGLDVFTNEPLDPHSPLRTFPNVITTPHIGWTVEEVFQEFAQIACTQLKQFMQGTLDVTE